MGKKIFKLRGLHLGIIGKKLIYFHVHLQAMGNHICRFSKLHNLLVTNAPKEHEKGNGQNKGNGKYFWRGCYFSYWHA